MEHASGIFAMDEAGIAANVETLNRIGIAATADMFDTSLLAEIQENNAGSASLFHWC